MSALPVAEIESTRRREDVLRELNLYPLWQRRHAVAVTHAAEEINTSLPQVPVEQLAEQAVAAEMPVADIGNLNWPELKKTVKSCTACKLRAGCTQTVFGTGDEKADWLFVGSWPSEDDEAKGEPFAGQAGQLLDNMLAAINLKRGANVYLANVVKCSGSIKRGPQADEIAQCEPYLRRQIRLLQPKIIVALGHAAATALLGEDGEWNGLLGKVHGIVSFTQDNLPTTIPLVVTHHPAALLLAPLNKAQAWRDLCLARDTMLKIGS